MLQDYKVAMLGALRRPSLRKMLGIQTLRRVGWGSCLKMPGMLVGGDNILGMIWPLEGTKLKQHYSICYIRISFHSTLSNTFMGKIGSLKKKKNWLSVQNTLCDQNLQFYP